MRLPADLLPSEWSTGRVKVMDGLSPEFDIGNTPWLREPMDALANPEAREIVVMAPIGTGKSTMLEAACCYIVSEDSGPTLIIAQTDLDLQDWAETRLDFAMRNTAETRILYPKDRYKAGKMKILFPHMPMFLTGANMSGLQSKSMRRVLCDEVWQWKRGMLNQARGRLHDRWNRQMFIMSQGGIKGDDLDMAYEKSHSAQFSFHCPKCRRLQTWKLSNLKWDWIETDGKRDVVKTSETARMICDNAECDFIIPDSSIHRREIAQSGFYVSEKTGSQGHFGYRYNVLANWRKPLREIAEIYIDALGEKDRGNIEPLRQFIQKRLAESWEERIDESVVTLSGSGYKLSEYLNGEIWEGEIERNMTIDRQQDHFWARIRAFKTNGDSRLLWCGKIQTEEMLRDIQLRYNVSDRVVGIDARFDSAHIYDLCAKYDWTALMGDKETEYIHKGGVKRMYSPIQRGFSVKYGKPVRLMLWTNGKVKDILHRIRQRQTEMAFEIPDDAPPDWHDHMRGEHKVEKLSRDNQIEYRWVRIGKRDNHLWDCEAMGIVLAMAKGIMSGAID